VFRGVSSPGQPPSSWGWGRASLFAVARIPHQTELACACRENGVSDQSMRNSVMPSKGGEQTRVSNKTQQNVMSCIIGYYAPHTGRKRCGRWKPSDRGRRRTTWLRQMSRQSRRRLCFCWLTRQPRAPGSAGHISAAAGAGEVVLAVSARKDESIPARTLAHWRYISYLGFSNPQSLLEDRHFHPLENKMNLNRSLTRSCRARDTRAKAQKQKPDERL
jgi:hypothetical protein